METEKPARKRDTEDRRREGITSEVEGFNERGRRAIQDRGLHDAVEHFTKKSVVSRNAVLNALPEAPELRERAYRIKQETMANLDRYLEQMADAIEGRGGEVYFARDGEDVVRYVADLARRRGAKVIAKSKSMATEEIELNRRLEQDYADLGLEIVETDLGEWIAQLAGDDPSHIVGPILHMNREEVAEVLSGGAGKKLPPNVEDLARFARQRLREKFLTGPRAEGELDGAEEMHLILLDNGRSELLGTEFEEALYCIRCGACLNVCPVYRQTGGHAYGSTYSGPIGAVITPLLKGNEEARDLPHASSLCGACSEACPVGIPLHELLLKLRNRQVEEGLASKAQRAAFKVFENTMKRPALYKLSGRASRAAQKPLLRDGFVRPIPGPMSEWTNSRDLPPLAKKSFRELWREGI